MSEETCDIHAARQAYAYTLIWDDLQTVHFELNGCISRCATLLVCV